ncbi:two-component system, sensor histidine kinase YesM [Paenibacillus sp. UNCCL117]|uniref:sensor histidine kinase n=1 Tax=unclassified Paenibacillus TaxID=185978 RepID=UPI000888723D|nr:MULTISPECIES: histidine kinase [unclassified Paenibacillus]SDD05261.1 two-component system, sensor histidine kinase YesM [Paenibacillus sp. cl123]SFW31919.1 two-component system, sensor histidine kinase YesM [Paenibacillus sp. UNCCL117]
MFNAVNRLLLKLRVKQKLLLSYLLLILFPILYLQFYASGKVAGIIQEMVSFSLNQSFNQTHSFLAYKLKRVTDISDLIAQDEVQLTRILTRNVASYTLYEQLEDGNRLTQFLGSHQDGMDISAVRLYMPQGFLFASEGNNTFRLEDITHTAWYRELDASRVKLMWFSSGNYQTEADAAPVISLVRLLRHPDRYNDTIGLLRIDMDERNLKAIVSRANTVKNSLTYLQSGDGLILIASDDKLMEQYLPAEGAAPAIFQQESDNHTQIVNGRRLEFLQLPIPQTNLTMVTVIPHQEIVSRSVRLQNELLVGLLAVGLLAIGLAHVISLHMTRRITYLSRKMKAVEAGSLEPIAKPSGDDEIGELIQSYNYMSRQLAMLKDFEMRAIKSELKALQSQINPHFLYNTLDQINWMAQIGMSDQIPSLVHSLAGYYKLTLSNGQDIITVEQELKLVDYYVQIQNIRFQQRIGFHVQIDEDIMQGLIPKLTLQPIIENAILHGILKSENREGVITITCDRQGEQLILTVADDGAGMDEAQLEALRSGGRINNPNGSGYGLRNVQERIKLYYGDALGLQFYSSPGDGMIVEVHMRYREDSDHGA